jgi:hypothetical protein
MKSNCIYLFLAVCLVFSACGKETVSGEMIYKKKYEPTVSSSVVSTNSDCAKLLKIVEQGINDRKNTYNKEWSVAFSGPSVDEALTSADALAVEDYDAAVASLKKWQKDVADILATKTFGPGSFKIGYVVKVWRDKVLKESEEIIFEYRYSK